MDLAANPMTPSAVIEDVSASCTTSLLRIYQCRACVGFWFDAGENAVLRAPANLEIRGFRGNR